MPNVVGLFPRVTLHAILMAGNQSIAGQGAGIDGIAEARFFDQLNFIEGGNFGSQAGIVLGRGLAKGLDVHIGDKIQLVVRDMEKSIRIAKVSVAGVFHTGSQEFDSRAFRIPLKVAQELLGTRRVETVSVALSGVDAWPAFERAATTRFPELEAIPFDELDKVYYRHAVDWLDAQFNFTQGIFLLMVFLGILNIISMTVLERTAEIGTLRANGQSRSEIALSHILEASAMGLLGGGIGILCGWAVSEGLLSGGITMPPAPGITRSFNIFIELGIRDAIEVFILCTVTSVAGCLLPVWRTTHMSIVEALRYT